MATSLNTRSSVICGTPRPRRSTREPTRSSASSSLGSCLSVLAERAEELFGRLRNGNRRAAGRVISLIEDESPEVEAIMRTLYPYTGNTYAVGVTGPPGGGKSTLVDELIRVLREDGKTVGVVAVDPNSPFSGGAILGDRIR